MLIERVLEWKAEKEQQWRYEAKQEGAREILVAIARDHFGEAAAIAPEAKFSEVSGNEALEVVRRLSEAMVDRRAGRVVEEQEGIIPASRIQAPSEALDSGVGGRAFPADGARAASQRVFCFTRGQVIRMALAGFHVNHRWHPYDLLGASRRCRPSKTVLAPFGVVRFGGGNRARIARRL